MHNSIPREFGTQNKFLNLPDTSYWLSREEIILSYLFQRNAAVPQVLQKDLVDNSLTLRHVGHSADQLTRLLPRSADTDQAALHILEQTVCALLNIHHLGVQHLDVALRNIATINFDKVDVKILDFTHALSAHHKLQKPLPLIPVDGLHHERLINALVEDWKNYFHQLGKTCPTLNENLSISNEEFTSYWSDTTNAQLLCDDTGILSHSISNLILEIANTVISNHNLSRELLNQANNMRNLTNESGSDAIESAQTLISTLIGKQGHIQTCFSNATPIPKITTDQVGKTTLLRDTSPFVLYSNEKKQRWISWQQWFKSRLFVSILWLTAAANVFFIDLVVTNNSYRLSNSALYACIGTLFLTPALMLCGFLFKTSASRVLSRLSLILLTATEFFVLIDCISLSTSNWSAWVSTPLLLIASLLVL